MKKHHLQLISLILAAVLICSSLPVMAQDKTVSSIDASDAIVEKTDVSVSTLISRGSVVSSVNSYETVTSAVLPDGVYALKNLGNSGLYMDVEQNIYIAGYHVQQYAYSPSPTESFSRGGLFKITKDTETDYYIIRSMLNNRMSFGFSGNEVITKYIRENDAEVPLSDMFSIVRDGSGYVIRPYDSTYVVAANNTSASGMAGAPDSFLAKRTLSSAGNRGRWEMQKYTGSSQYGGGLRISPSSSYGLEMGKQYSIMPYIWSTDLDENTSYLSISSSCHDKVEYEYVIGEHTMYVEPKAAGTLTFVFRIRKDGTATTAHLLGANATMIPKTTVNETYFIRNIGTNRYIDIEGPSSAEGAIIQQWQYNGKNQSKWLFEKASGGYFYIQSLYSGKYIGVDSTNTSVIRQYASKSDYTLWRFITTTSGNFRIVNKAISSTVLAAPTATSGNGADLIATSYTGNSVYNDEWMIYRRVLYIDNYYDSTIVGNTAYQSFIPTAVECANKVFYELAQIGIISNGSASAYLTGLADQCPAGINVPCSDATCSTGLFDICLTSHHKNGLAISNDIDDNISRADDHVVTLWTHRDSYVYCDSDPGHVLVGSLGVVYFHRPIVHIMHAADNPNNDWTNSDILEQFEANMGNTLAHELVHTFGMGDVYDDPTHAGKNCIMTGLSGEHSKQMYNDICDGKHTGLCTSCENELLDYYVYVQTFEGN